MRSVPRTDVRDPGAWRSWLPGGRCRSRVPRRPAATVFELNGHLAVRARSRGQGRRGVVVDAGGWPAPRPCPARCRRKASATRSRSTRGGPARSWTGRSSPRPSTQTYRQPGHIKVPFWLQPERYYAGAAWYQRDVEIPKDWQGRRVVLRLERPHWETRVWLDGTLVGSNDSLSTPHEYDLGTSVAPGRHVLTIRVDNGAGRGRGRQLAQHQRPHAGQLERHRRTDGARGHAAGVDRGPAGLPGRRRRRAVRVTGRIGNATGPVRPWTTRAWPSGVPRVERAGTRTPASARRGLWTANGGTFDARATRSAPTPRRGTSSRPRSTRCRRRSAMPSSSREVTFGLREIATEGTQFTINGRRTFLRGTLECCIFPKTGHPPTDVESWKRIIRIAKAHGLNQMRFHSWCPPEAAFEAADELGFYYQVEASLGQPVHAASATASRWTTGSTHETDRILRAYGNHPSFLLMPLRQRAGRRGPRLTSATWVARNRAARTRAGSNERGRAGRRSRRTSSTSRPTRASRPGAPGSNRASTRRPPETRTDYRDYIAARPVPVISHEIGAVVRLSELRGDAEIHRLPQAEELRDLPRPPARAPPGRPGARFPARVRQAADALLQGGDRVGAAHAGHGRLRAARSARFPRPGHGAGRRARSVLGGEGLRHAGGVSAASAGARCRWRG